MTRAVNDDRPDGVRRILHVTQPVEAGVAVVVLSLLDDQAHRGWDVSVACPPDGDLPIQARAGGHRVIEWSAERAPGLRIVRETWRLFRIIRRTKPDLVHLHSSKAGLVGRLAIRGSRATVFQPHAWSFLAVDGRQATLALRWERFASRWCDRVLAVSASERDLASDAGVDVAHALVVHNGVDTNRYQPVPAGVAADLRRALEVGPHPLVVCVGRICGQKGQDLLLAAWPAIRQQVPDAVLAFVGDGPRREELVAAGTSGVMFPGASDRVADWFAVSDVVAAPSRWEGQSLALLEAMACGASIVATEVAGVREALGADGGAVVAIGDADALAQQVVERLTNAELRRAEGVANRQRVLTSFALHQTTAGVAKVYGDVWAERTSSAH